MPRRPLYAQIYEDLRQRMGKGEWAPGQAIPPEMTLARDLGVSQGTVRRAVEMLCEEGALVRRQGRGTFVAEQTAERANFRFFRFTDSLGAPVTPELLRQISAMHPADEAQAGALGIALGEPVHVLDRIRTVSGEKVLIERVAVPDEIMPGLSAAKVPPNALYPYYQANYGVTVLSTDERIGATAANARQARQLGVSAGEPLLEVRRIAKDLQERRVEYRVFYAVTRALAFSVTLR